MRVWRKPDPLKHYPTPYYYEQSFSRLTWSLVMIIILEKKASVGYGVPCGSAYGIFHTVQISGRQPERNKEKKDYESPKKSE